MVELKDSMKVECEDSLTVDWKDEKMVEIQVLQKVY